MKYRTNVYLVAACGLAILVPCGNGYGQDRGRFPGFGPIPAPDQFFERMFAGPSEADEKALETISISRQEETQYGERAVATYLADLKRQRVKVTQRGQEVEYLKKLAAKLRPMLRNAERYRTLDIYVVESPVCEAKSFPGGTLFFYQGLLELAESEAALVGVVGHELSHLDHGHQLLPLKQSRLMERSFGEAARGLDPREFFTAGTTIMRLMSRPFRPQDEAAADLDGTDWAYRAGYDPREMIRLLMRMRDLPAARVRAQMPAFLRTHPLTAERIEAIEGRYRELQRETPRPQLYIGQVNLQRRVPRDELELADEFAP